MKRQNDALSSPLNTADILTNTALLRLFQIHDSAFPIGSYTQSYGMETYIQEDIIRTKEDLLAFCRSYLFQNLVYGDAILIQEAHHATRKNDVDRLLYLEQLCGAIKLAKESREASINIGRQFIRTVAPLEEHNLLEDWHRRIQSEEIKGHYAILYGVYTATTGVACEMAIMTYLYSSISGLIQNAVRAVPFGQNAGVQVTRTLISDVTKATALVGTLTEADLCNNALGIELASMKHEYLFSRLFIS